MATQKQDAFAIAYVKLGNASLAYRSAYDAERMSDEAVRVEASRLLARPNISLRIAALRLPAEKAASLSAERTLTEIARGAYGNPGDLLSWSDKLRGLDMAMKYHGLYERDNAQRAPSLALQIVSVGNE